MAKKDFYEILGVSKTANDDEIKKSYRKLVMKYHPDKNPGNKEYEEKFKEISEAYDVLSDPEKRRKYDSFGHDGAQFGGGAGGGFEGFSGGFSDIFNEFFGGGAGGGNTRRRHGGIHGADLQFSLTITLEEAYSGCEKKISFKCKTGCTDCKGAGGHGSGACSQCGGSGAIRIQQGFFMTERTCGSCSGSGRSFKEKCKTCKGDGRNMTEKTINAKIPSGIDSGQKILLEGQGEAGAMGGKNGDFFVLVSVKPHDTFERQGDDLHARLNIPLTYAIFGDKVEITTMSGMEKITIKPGIQSSETISIKGKGMKSVRSSRYGDLIVHISVEIPSKDKLSKKEIELFENIKNLASKKDINLAKNTIGKKFF